MDLYEYDKKIDAAEKLILNADYSDKNKELIIGFENTIFAEGLSKARVLKYLSSLHNLAQWFDKPFPEVTKLDVYKLVGDLEKSDRSVWTKRDYRVTLKRFFRWLYDTKTDPECTEWITTNVKHKDRKIPEELLDQKEILSMVEAADHPRDAAIAAVWYDSGGRVGENGTRQLKHIGFDDYGAYEIVKGKTGMRRVRLVMATPYLASWMAIHPDKNNPEAPLWVNIGKNSPGQPMKYPAIRKVIKKLATKAGINKRVYNQLFRHSRATELANHLTQAQMESHLGWVHGSDMPGTYIHLSGQQVDAAILKMHGLVKEEENEQLLTPIKCPRCKQLNGPTAKYCSTCRMALTTEAAQEVDDDEQLMLKAMKNFIKNHPEKFGELM